MIGKAEDMMPVRKPPQRSEDQLPNGHMSEPITKQRIAYSQWPMANTGIRDQRLGIRERYLAKGRMPSRWPPQRSEDQTSRGYLPKHIEIRH